MTNSPKIENTTASFLIEQNQTDIVHSYDSVGFLLLAMTKNT